MTALRHKRSFPRSRFLTLMTDRTASWRMPTPKQMEKLATRAGIGRSVPPAPTPGPGDEMPPEYWQALLDDGAADRELPGPSIRTQRLSEIQRHLLRVGCRRCGRTVENRGRYRCTRQRNNLTASVGRATDPRPLVRRAAIGISSCSIVRRSNATRIHRFQNETDRSSLNRVNESRRVFSGVSA
jgi:hypothetical protein